MIRVVPAYTPPVLGTLLFLGIALLTVVVATTCLIVAEIVRPRRITESWAIARGLPSDPGECGLAFTSWDTSIGDGRTLPVWDVTGRGGDAAPVVVFLHGFGGSRMALLGALPVLVAEAKRVVLYDRVGHGGAAGLALHGVGEADHLRGVLEQVNDGPLVLIGQGDSRAIIAETLANAAWTDRVKGVALLGEARCVRQIVDDRLSAHRLPRWLLAPLVRIGLWLVGIAPHERRVEPTRWPVPMVQVDAAGEGVAARVIASPTERVDEHVGKEITLLLRAIARDGAVPPGERWVRTDDPSAHAARSDD